MYTAYSTDQLESGVRRRVVTGQGASAIARILRGVGIRNELPRDRKPNAKAIISPITEKRYRPQQALETGCHGTGSINSIARISRDRCASEGITNELSRDRNHQAIARTLSTNKRAAKTTAVITEGQGRISQ